MTGNMDESISEEPDNTAPKKLRGTLSDVWNHRNPYVELAVKMTPRRPAFEKTPDEGCILPEVHCSPFEGIPADDYVKTVISIDSSDEEEDFLTWRNKSDSSDLRNTIDFSTCADYSTIQESTTPTGAGNSTDLVSGENSVRNNVEKSKKDQTKSDDFVLHKKGMNSNRENSNRKTKSDNEDAGTPVSNKKSKTSDVSVKAKKHSRKERSISTDDTCKIVKKKLTEHSVEKLIAAAKSLHDTQDTATKTSVCKNVTKATTSSADGKEKNNDRKGKNIKTPDKKIQKLHLVVENQNTDKYIVKKTCINISDSSSQPPTCSMVLTRAPDTSSPSVSSKTSAHISSHDSRGTPSTKTMCTSNKLSVCSAPAITTQSNNCTVSTSSSISNTHNTRTTKTSPKQKVSEVERLSKGMGAVKQLKKRTKEKRTKEVTKKQRESPPTTCGDNGEKTKNNVSTTKEVDDIVSKLLVSQKKIKYVRKENNQEGLEYIIPKKKPALRSTAISMIRDTLDDDASGFIHRLNEMHGCTSLS